MKRPSITEQNQFASDVASLIRFAQEKGFQVSFGEAWRPQVTQDLYFKRGSSKTLKSFHSLRLAVDLNFFLDDEWIRDFELLRPLGKYWKSLNSQNVWGGDWGWDACHFQRGK
jgi:hypothetical protein